MKHIILAALMLSGLGSITVVATPMGLTGDTIDAAVLRTIPDPFYGYGRICCYGLDAPFVVADGLSDQKKYSSAFLLNVDDMSFDIDFISMNGWQDGIVLRVSDLDFMSMPTNGFALEIETNINGLTWAVGTDYFDINLFTVHQTEDSYIKGKFSLVNTPAPVTVPEPSNLALILLGAAGIFFRLTQARHIHK